MHRTCAERRGNCTDRLRVSHLDQTEERGAACRYKGILVEKDSYLLELIRYVVLNPVRAGMVDDAGNWPWSSYLAMVGMEEVPPWLQTDWTLAQFGIQRKRAITRYVDFVRAGVGVPSVWTELRNQIYLGGERFVAKMQKHVAPDAESAEVPRAQRRAVAKPLEYYRNRHEAREGMALAYLSGDYSMKAVAEYFGVHYSTVSRAVSEYESEAL